MYIHLDQMNLVNKGKERTFSRGDQQEIPSRQDRPIMSARVANQSA